MNRQEYEEYLVYVRQREAAVEALGRLLLTLAITALSIATPLLAAGAAPVSRTGWLKAALLALCLGALASGVRIHAGVRIARCIVETLLAQHASGHYPAPIACPLKWHEKHAEKFSYICYVCALVAFALAVLL